MLFIDASVVVAILLEEEDGKALMARLDQDGGPFYVSAIVRMEATLALTRDFAAKTGKPATSELVDGARRAVDQFFAEIDVREAMVSGDIGSKAIDAAQRYGKLMGHPAKLNMGDCYSYACAKAYRARVAYKGNDFSETDIGW